jgi:cytochrome P450
METDWTVAVLRYGDSWRRKRKLLHAHVHQGAAERYHPIQIASARRFARDILVADTEPHVLPRAVRLNFAQMILKATYGIDVESYESEYISLPEKVLANIGDASTPGRFFVNVLPIREFQIIFHKPVCPHSQFSEICPSLVPWGELPESRLGTPGHAASYAG